MIKNKLKKHAKFSQCAMENIALIFKRTGSTIIKNHTEMGQKMDNDFKLPQELITLGRDDTNKLFLTIPL